MLEAMRVQALDYLFAKLETGEPPPDLDAWFAEKMEKSPKDVFPYLIESAGKVEKVYIIQKAEEKGRARVEIQDVRSEIERGLPFVKPTGSQSPAVGPVIKRTFDKTKGAGPSEKIIHTTLQHFARLASERKTWSCYFKDVLNILKSESVEMFDGSVVCLEEKGYGSVLECVVKEIGPRKDTVFVAVRSSSGKLPGEVDAYLKYLSSEVLAGERYLTKKVEAVSGSVCALCGRSNQEVFANALKGAGINLTNLDRHGRFPGLRVEDSWKGFAACVNCANLLYVYKNHVLKPGGPKKNIRPYMAPVAGDNALIVPSCSAEPSERLDIWKSVREYLDCAGDYVVGEDEELLEILAQGKAVLNLTFLWADIGQLIEKVTGFVTDVPPTRLRFLSEFNEKSESWIHPAFPSKLLKSNFDSLVPDLALSAFRSLFRRPGGRKAPNSTRKLVELKRFLAASVYHDRKLAGRFLSRLLDEIHVTAKWWWMDAIEKKDAMGVLYEGNSKKGTYLTAAGWIRHWAWWMYYFKRLGVIEMEKNFCEPEWEGLKPYLGPESGIDSEEKAFAFVLGVVYGRLILVQKKAGFSASSLNWAKRFGIDGRGLPELYRKVMAKLIEYERLSDKEFGKLFTKRLHQAIEELSLLGSRLGDEIELPSNLTAYYLLLGLSLSNKILKRSES